MTRRLLPLMSLLLLPCHVQADEATAKEYQQRVETVRQLSGFVALWDFVLRDPATGQFMAHQPLGSSHDFRLEAANYVHDYWGQGRPATYEDFPLLGRGPFGQAVRFLNETDETFRPCLLVPRERLHDTGLDVKGPGGSVSMVAWVVRESGNHAIAGIWHEGTDLHSQKGPILRVEQGRRQYGIFAGLGAKSGASAVHVSENGAKSFGDKYARNLAVTPELIPTLPPDASPEMLDATWSLLGFTFDNKANTVTAYLNGQATDYWITSPEKQNFFKWPAHGWLQAQLHKLPGLQEGEDPDYPADQYYQPPEDEALKIEVVSESPEERVELHQYPFTRVRVILGKDAEGRFTQVKKRELVALKANPFWFPHDLYTPPDEKEGGPFTIGRFIHTGRSVGFTGYIGGVAVFNQALTPEQMAQLAALGHEGNNSASLKVEEIQAP
ncbi:hypothetical protein EI77_01220 [Prosthecobacter fusiformis]|uniref:Concanavalin A-like lectin/glucanase superfamily protein n=1 Tax=Prosthecobacter fusiformis TaxID=48464 RepID=A0A4R7SUD9_9BACT|nr:hypothetical protein [Prosthecobacter fusiformis]TDU81908.1 hypothetical protein EI77_01220 [Prosthecobacter fusiformis]